MLPTLRDHEIVIAVGLNGNTLSYGDIVVFKKPPQNRDYWVKRVVGLPGDTVQIKDGTIYINNTPIYRKQLTNYSEVDAERSRIIYKQYLESFQNGRQYFSIDEDNGPLEIDNTSTYAVPRGQYFVIGDNRDNSIDSRLPISGDGTGFIPAENIGYIVRWVIRPLPKTVDGEAASLR